MHLLPVFRTLSASPPTALALALALAGCASGPPIDARHACGGQESRVQFIVIHYTVGAFPSALKSLTQGPFSNHCLMAVKPPPIYRLVDEQRLAEHGFAVPRSGALDEATRRVLQAFQMKYRTTPVNGLPDAATAALLAVVTRPGGLLITDPATGVRSPYLPN